MMNCADLARIINSDQVQAKLKDIKHSVRVHDKTRKNPLKNKAIKDLKASLNVRSEENDAAPDVPPKGAAAKK